MVFHKIWNANVQISVKKQHGFPCAEKKARKENLFLYFKSDNTISGAKPTLMTVHKLYPISFADAPSNQTSSSTTR